MAKHNQKKASNVPEGKQGPRMPNTREGLNACPCQKVGDKWKVMIQQLKALEENGAGRISHPLASMKQEVRASAENKKGKDLR